MFTAAEMEAHRAHAMWWRELWWSAIEARTRAPVLAEEAAPTFVVLVPGHEIDSDSTTGRVRDVVRAARAHGWAVRVVRSCHADVKGFHEVVTVRYRRPDLGWVRGERGYGAWQDGRFLRALLVHPGGRWEILGWARAGGKRALLDVIEGVRA
jgi:hypothetical protein